MLDVVMVAHKPNFDRMAHRGLSPIASETDTAVRGSLQSAVDLVPMAGKVILSLEDGQHRDFEAAEAYLSGQNLPWQILHNDEGVDGYYTALMRALEKCSSALVAIVPPWCEVTDNLWVQRMTWCLSNDPRSLLVTTGEKQGPARDLAPFICVPRKWPGGEIILGRRAELTDILRLLDPADFYANLAKAVDRSGWRLWCHPGIRFNHHPHSQHEPDATVAR